MKSFTKLSLLMLAFLVSTSVLWAQNMTQEEMKFHQRLEMQKDAALGPVTTAPGSTRAPGDACTDPLAYGNINAPAQGGSIVSYGEQWYSFTGPDDMSVTVSLCGSGYDTKLEVWNACSDGSYAFYNDDACGVQSEIGGVPFVGGSTHYVKVYGYGSSSGSYTLSITGTVVVNPDPIAVFPFSEDFDSGSFPGTIVPESASQSDITLTSYAGHNSSYGAMFEGGPSSWGATPSTVGAAFGYTDHVAKMQMDVVPTGQAGVMKLEFDLVQRYSFNANYEWLRVLVNGNPIADENGNLYHQASTNTGDAWGHVVYDLSAYQVLGSFDLTIENSAKYDFQYYNDGDLGCVDNISMFYLTIGDVEGYVMNGDGLSISGATVYMDGYPSVTTDPTGAYSLLQVAGEWQDVSAWKEGYNVTTDNIYITPGGSTSHNFTLTKPSLTINPLFFDETLNPGEYLTTYLGILNTGDGDGMWEAEINYPSSSSAGGSNPVPANSYDWTNIDLTGANLSTIPGGNGQAMNTRAGFDCPDGSKFAYPAVGSDNGYTSDATAGWQCFQSFSGATGAFTKVTAYAIHTSAPSGPRELLVEVYGPGGSPGTLESTTIESADPVNTGVQVIGYDTYAYTIEIPSSSLVDGWISVQATAGGSPTFYWLNTYATPSYPALQGTGALPAGLAMCLHGGGNNGWLSLSDYDGTVAASGGSQNVGVNFDAAGTEAGDVYTAEIVMTTDPDVGTFNIPVTMTIFGDPLDPATDLEANLVNMVTGQVDLSWQFSSTNPTFQYFAIKRDGITVGTSTTTLYSDFAPTFGTYCYTVTPVYQEGNGTPAGPECIDWLIPALCWTPASLYNEQWPDVEEDVMLTLENCGDGMLDFTFPDYVSGKGFACTMQVGLFDSYGDGWNGGTLSVFVNGNIVLDNITLASGSGPECFGFPAETGDDISTVFTPGGWSYECSYDFLDGDGNVIYSAGNVSLPVGVVYGTCAQPSYIVDVEPAAGQIPSGGTLDVTVTYSSAGFPAGSYDEWLNIETNDPARLSDSVANTMVVYIPGSIFGQVTDCNTGIGMGGVTVEAVGDLGPTYYATTDGSGNYMMYVDADNYGVKFEKLGFETELGVAIVTSGNATELNASMCETPYPVQWVFADPNQDDTQCEVTWTLPMGPYSIVYDDGQANDYVIWNSPGGAVGVDFTPAGYPATVIGGSLYVGDGSFPGGTNFLGTQMAIGVLDDDGTNGMPGTILDSIPVDVANYGWVDFTGLGATISDGDFYIVMWQLGLASNSAPVGVDTDLPTVYRSVVHLPGGSGWSTSPYQDFMIRAVVDGPNAGVVSSAVGSMVRLPKVTQGPFLATSMPTGVSGTIKDGEFLPMEVTNATRDLTNYTVARVSNFDPDLGPETGTLTPIANPTTEMYNDAAFGAQPAGFYAYAVKAVYESNESIWVYSNVVGHLLANEFTVEVSLCDGNEPSDAEVLLIGQDYPYDFHVGYTDAAGIVVFDSVIDGYYDLFVEKVGYSVYEHYNLAIFDDQTYSLVLTEKAYAPRNFMVDELSSHATWDEPLITALFTETFEDPAFPPARWQSSSEGVGWYRSDDAGTGAWAIPEGDGFYAVSNDDAAGSTNDGEDDYLITPELDLRESDDFTLYFSSFFDAAYGQSAYVEYSYDGGATWEVLYAMSPTPGAWTDVDVSLAALSGLTSSNVWLAFHSDDNGNWGSGWAVDNVAVKNGPSPVLGYYVYLNDAFVGSTDATTREWTYMDLAYGETYEGCVRALYACGLSDEVCYTWTSTYLHPPRELDDTYVYGTNEVPLMWLPPMTGTIPMTSAFKVVYVGPQLSAVGPNVEAASEVTIIEFDNPQSTRDFGDFQFAFPTVDNSGEAGCESDGEFVYTSLWNGSTYFKYDLAGNMIESFGIAGTSGVRDLAYDGEFMYGAAASTTVYVMDFTTQTLVTSFTAPTAVRAIAYNHNDMTFYGNNWGTDIVTFDASGANLGSFTPSVTSIYGLAYDDYSDPGNEYLWAYDQGANNLVQYTLPDGSATGLTLDVGSITGATALAGGAYTTPALWAPDKVTIGGNAQNETLWGIELADYSGGGGGGGMIPDGLVSFNVYQDGVNIANVPYEGQAVDEHVYHVVNNLDPGTYLFDVSAVYDLTIFGFPGDFGESAWEGTDTVEVVWGYDLPFFEGWDQGTFTFQQWRFNDNADNWMINPNVGDPEPSAQFNWDPLLENDYTSTLTSNPITADLLTEGDIWFDFDLMLDDRNSTGMEMMLVEVWNGSSWSTVAEFANNGSFGWESSHIDITNHAMGGVFQVRFNAVGQNSFDVISWLVDNISIYRECMPPTDLIGGYVWNVEDDFGAEICWEAPFIPGPISEWIHWDDGTPFSAIGLTDGGTFSVAARWDAGQLSDYAGTSITKMQYVVEEGFTDVELKIWEGTSLVWNQNVTATSVAGMWNEVDLTPLSLNVSDELWVGYTITHTAGTFSAATDGGPAVAGYGDMISLDGVVWESMATAYGLDYNWNVQFYVTEVSSSASSSVTLVDNAVYDNASTSLSQGPIAVDPQPAITETSRDMTGFNVWRMEEGATEYEPYDFVAYVQGQASYCYFDPYPEVMPQMGYYYMVTASYASETDACESAPAMALEIPEDDFVYVFVTGIDDPNTIALTNLYPNPAQDNVTVTSSVPMNKLTVTNYVGQVVYTGEMFDATSVELNTSSYQAGVYLVKIDTDNGIVTKQVVITR